MNEDALYAEVEWRTRRMRIEYRWVEGPANAALMIFLHEGLGSVSMWRDFPRQLCAALGCRGLVYSRPGYGRSTSRAPKEHWAADFMHRQAHELLPALLAQLGIGDTAPAYWLFGHSDGASIALLHAARFPQRVVGAIVLAPHIMVEPVALHSIAQARKAYREGDLRQRLARYHDDVDSAFYGWNDIWLADGFRDWSIEAEIEAIRCPVLAVQGRQDEYGTLAQVEGVARHIPGAELVVLEDCGHSPHRDQPQALLAAVQPFFSR